MISKAPNLGMIFALYFYGRREQTHQSSYKWGEDNLASKLLT